MTEPRPAPPVLSARVNALLELTSSEQYRVAQQKRQAGEPLTEEEQRILARVERHARHLDGKESWAEALAKAAWADVWVPVLLLGGLLGGSILLALKNVGNIERAAKNVGNIERAAQNMYVTILFASRRKEQDS
ncbi:hypothetical protein ABPG77_003538 [Micractinium sp. CCAP 211/92]